MNIILNIDINNVFQQHAFINTCMRIVASICVNITPNTSRNFIYSALQVLLLQVLLLPRK